MALHGTTQVVWTHMGRPFSFAIFVSSLLDVPTFFLFISEVECYNPRNDVLTSCPTLLRKKGNLAACTLNGKIYAIGGGDGSQCFSDVEMFDPALGKWVNNQPMLKKV